MERAYAWLRRYGRPLELALWEYFFSGGPKENVLRCLAAFQNADGGFGHGLEPDFWLPRSSPMASWMAGQILVDIQADPEEGIVRRLRDYLLGAKQVQPGMWPSVLPENNAYPHAPWWEWTEAAQQDWMFNPSVELAAFLIHWSGGEGPEADLGWSSLGAACEYLLEAESVEWHGLKNYWQCLKLLRPFKERFPGEVGCSFGEVEAQARALILEVIDRDLASWGKSYKPLPLDFVKSPADPLYPELKPLVEENLRVYLRDRDEDGIWDITWGWQHYPEEFAVARRYWQGILAVERYRVLNALGSL